MPVNEELRALILGYRLSSALAVAADLGLSDVLADGPRGVDELAEATGADPDGLSRLLRALASLGVYAVQDGRYALTPLGEGLLSGTPGSLRPLARTLTDPALWAAWGHLGHSVRTGENGFEALHGLDVWAHRRRHPEHNAIFNANMASLSADVADDVAAAYDFTGVSTVVDVGGGLGALLDAVLSVHEHLSGAVFDQPHVVGRRPPSGSDSVAARWSAESGDFFESVPPADCYLLKWILHDWDDERCVAILRACREALRPDGVVLVVERLLDRPGREAEVAFSDLNMLVLPGGRERSAAEFAALFASAGLASRRVIHTRGPLSILEAVASSGRRADTGPRGRSRS